MSAEPGLCEVCGSLIPGAIVERLAEFSIPPTVCSMDCASVAAELLSVEVRHALRSAIFGESDDS